jgi:hypothetical protein
MLIVNQIRQMIFIYFKNAVEGKISLNNYESLFKYFDDIINHHFASSHPKSVIICPKYELGII